MKNCWWGGVVFYEGVIKFIAPAASLYMTDLKIDGTKRNKFLLNFNINKAINPYN